MLAISEIENARSFYVGLSDHIGYAAGYVRTALEDTSDGHVADQLIEMLLRGETAVRVDLTNLIVFAQTTLERYQQR